MGALTFFKSLFGLNKAESKDTFRKLRPVEGIPSEYERWADNDTTGLDARYYNPQNELFDFLTLFQVHPWVYSAASAVATAISGVPYRIRDKKQEEVKEGPLINVFARPNPHEVWYEFSELMRLYLEMTGNAFIEEVRDNDGNLMAMYLMRPDKVKIIPHPKVKVAGYIYEPRPGRQIMMSSNEVTHIKYASTIDEYFGISPAYAAQNSIILDMYATKYQKQFFINSAVPQGVLQTDGSLSDQTYQRLKRDWAKRHKGVDNAFELAVLEEGLKYTPIGFNQRDMMMTETKEMSREDVLSCYRVPPAIVGFLKAGHFGTVREQRKMFYTDNIFPKCEKTQQVFNEQLMPDGFEFEYITDDVAPMIEDVSISTTVAMSLVSHGIQTINEVRKKFFAMKEVPWGDKPWIPVGLAQWDPNPATSVHPETPNARAMTQPERARTQNATEARNQSTPMGGSMPHPPNPNADPFGKKIEFEKMVAPEPDWQDHQAVHDWRIWNLWKGLATPDYLELKNFFRTAFLEQFNAAHAVIKNYYHPSEKTEKRLGRISKMLNETYEGPYDIFKATEEDAEKLVIKIDLGDKRLKVKLQKKARPIAKKHGQFLMGQIGSKSSFDLENERASKFLQKWAGDQISWINQRTRNILKRELSKAYKAGEDYSEVMDRLNNVFKGELAEDRLRKIARTETVTLTQWSKLEAALQSGTVEKKRWVCSLLKTSRESHVDVHDTEIGINEMFKVRSRSGYDEMAGPGDDTADPENLVDCLCVLDFPGSTPELDTLEGDIPEDEMGVQKRGNGGVTVNLNVQKIINETRPEVKVLIEKPPAPIVNNNITVPPAKPADIKVIPEAPVVNNIMPEIKPVIKNFIEAPKLPVQKIKPPDIIVNVAPANVKVDVPPANVKVDVNSVLKMPKRKKRTEVERDPRTGRVVRTEETEEDAG